MAVERKLQGLHIVLILFVTLTIALGVTTVWAFKSYQEEEVQRKKAEQSAAAARTEQKQLEKDIAEIKTIGGWNDDDSVEDVIADFNRDKELFGTTYGETPQQVYPQMLKIQLEKHKNLEDQVTQHLATIAQYQSDISQLQAAKEKVNQEFRSENEKLTEKANSSETRANEQQQKHEKTLADHDAQIGEERRASKQAFDEEKVKREKVIVANTKLADQLGDTTKALTDLIEEPLDFTRPDGEIIATSTTVGLVYVNRGRKDGLRRQTIFDVFGHDATLRAPETLEPKGQIEIVEIIDDHRSLARILSDTVSDPILPGDKIHSFIYRPGMPERFAFAGIMDVDGDGKDDLDRLRSLIQINGAKLDAFVAADGSITGELTERTRYLVLGDKPRKESDEEARESYEQLSSLATEYPTVKIRLETFLDYIGLQADDQRYDLSHQQRDRDEAAGPGEDSGKEQPFRKRPARGEEGAF